MEQNNKKFKFLRKQKRGEILCLVLDKVYFRANEYDSCDGIIESHFENYTKDDLMFLYEEDDEIDSILNHISSCEDPWGCHYFDEWV